MNSQDLNPIVVAIVGPCASGKSTLREGLEKHGYLVRHIAQEHSFMPDLWRKLIVPDVLIFLDVSFQVSLNRRHQNWTTLEYDEQVRRLSHARTHADITINSDTLNYAQVLQAALHFLRAFAFGQRS